MSICDSLLEHARRSPDAQALLAPGRDTMTYDRLLAQVERALLSEACGSISGNCILEEIRALVLAS